MGFEESVYHPYDFANRRHIGPSPVEMAEMLTAVYAHLYRDTVPDLAALPPEARLEALIDGVFAPKAFSRL